MGSDWRFGGLVMLLVIVDDDFGSCESIVRNWADFAFDGGAREDKSNLKDLLFFLHAPRTGGRTYFHCFLRRLYTSDQECPRSYDKLHFNPSKSKCRLMATHDDYSLMSRLPKERTSVVTILRNPIDRVFSTYEFCVEVAARFLVHPNLTSATQMSVRIRPKSRGVSTLDIWPWKYLVPWMREDLFYRREARNHMRSVEMKEINDPYDMGEMVMPLHTFINHPIAHDIIHNGATFQVPGLTNNSCLPESHNVRLCVRKHPVLGHYVLDVAKKTLESMLYVGLTEDHKESATMFANLVGEQVISQSDPSHSIEGKATNSTELSSPSYYSPPDDANQIQSSINGEMVDEVPSPKDAQPVNMTVENLMEAYETCISSLRKTQGSRRSASLKRIAPANFSKKARSLVPKTLLHQIFVLNSLDVELYKHAQNIFSQQHDYLSQRVHGTGDDQNNKLLNTGLVRSIGAGLYGCLSFNFVGVAIIFILVLLYLVATAKRQTSKLKV